jgi:CheY-like chemotaxis protein
MKSTPPKFNTVMLIEDNEIDNYINEKILKGSGYAKNVFVHTSVKSALEFLKHIEKSNGQPDILVPEYIFLDLNLPILDGFHFLEEFEMLFVSIKSKIKIVILTCSLIPDDRERALKHKYVVGFLSKPLRVEDLMQLECVKSKECHKVEFQD